MNLNFEHRSLGQRVVFGAGKAAENLAAEVARLDAKRVMVIATRSAADNTADITAGIPVALHYDDVVPHVPVETAEKARDAATEHGIDALVCIGGGSATGLAKAIALTTGLPIVAVPTTYAGSEGTNVWGLTDAGRKTTGVDDRVLPVTVIYDAELTLSLPAALSVASGLNAMAHCIDAMWAPGTDPINQVMAAEGIRALNRGLPLISVNMEDVEGRAMVLYGAYLSAVAFTSAGSAMHHKICHVLGGTWNMPHAETHATVLPYVLAFNAPAAPDAAGRIAAAFGVEEPVAGLNRLRDILDAPKALQNYGFTEADIAEAVELMLPVIPESNPRPVTRQNLAALLAAATDGDDPGTLTNAG